MASFLLRSSFFRTTRPMASSEATAYYRPAPRRTDSIPEWEQRPCDNGYKSVLTNSLLVCQRHVSWIKGLGKNPQKEWTHSLLAVPFVQGYPTMTPGTPKKRWHLYTSIAMMTRDVFTSVPTKTQKKNRNACIDAPQSVAQKKKNSPKIEHS